MMRKFITTFLFLIALTNCGVAQNDTINKLNVAGKKEGYWIVYLNERLFPTDSANAFFWHYTLYENGKDLYKLDIFKCDSLGYPCALPKKGSPICMDGIFIQFVKLGGIYTVTLVEEDYKKGFLQITRHYASYGKKLKESFENMYLWEVIDFTRQYNNEKGSYYVEFRGTKGIHIDKYWQRKVKGKWKGVKIKE